MNPVPPENSAVTAAAPADAKVCGRIATPSPVLTGAVPTSAPSTLNVTVPLLGMGETVAERLVGSPTTAVSGSTTVVVVPQSGSLTSSWVAVETESP